MAFEQQSNTEVFNLYISKAISTFWRGIAPKWVDVVCKESERRFVEEVMLPVHEAVHQTFTTYVSKTGVCDISLIMTVLTKCKCVKGNYNLPTPEVDRCLFTGARNNLALISIQYDPYMAWLHEKCVSNIYLGLPQYIINYYDTNTINSPVNDSITSNDKALLDDYVKKTFVQERSVYVDEKLNLVLIAYSDLIRFVQQLIWGLINKY